MVAEVIVNRKAKELDRVFDYEIPQEFERKIQIGSQVLIPFGRSSVLEEGFIVGIKEHSDYNIKQIAKIEEECVSADRVELAKWMAKRYFSNVSDCLRFMLPPGTTNKIQEKRIKEKMVQVASILLEGEKILNEENALTQKQKKILITLKENGAIPVSDTIVLAETSRSTIKALEKKGYIEIKLQQVDRDPFRLKTVEKNMKLKLTKEQEKAYNTILQALEESLYHEFLLYGVTGSGKTEVYLQLIEKVLQKGQGIILLVPEISLTPQTVDRFIARFGEEKIAILHSKLGVGERYDQWNKIKKGNAKIVIGARSAIFAPVENLGLIVIDEEHDSSYKSEMNPRYEAKEVARYIAKQKNIPLILGSATPDINTYQEAKKGNITLLTLAKRANQSQLPQIEIIDLRKELEEGNRSMISRKLYKEIEKNLKQKEQTILFLNRRGFSTFVMCRECGYTVNCKNCNITLTYHQDQEILKCHYCGYQIPFVTICPECKSKKIRYFGTGTQKLELEINKLFPFAKILRMDVDTTTKKNSHEEILTKFRNKKCDILIGTQMVVKGHHFSDVTLVGVIAADGNLNIGDYRSNEKTFQMLTQVSGRAGREKLKGRVIIQTYQPDHFAIQCVREQNYEKFYETEILLRNQLKYPPFYDIIVIGFTSENEILIQKVALELYKNIQNIIKEEEYVEIYKAMPAPINKIKNKYRWRIIIKYSIENDILEKIQNIIKEIKETRVIISLDRNPTNML